MGKGASATSTRTASDGALHVVVIGLATAVLATWLGVSNRGLDRVDESFALAYISDPDAARDAGEISASGFLLHPLFVLVGGDVGSFRMVGALLVAAVSAWGAEECSRAADVLLSERTPPWRRVAMAAAAATVSMTVFTFGLRSLTYVSIVLCGLMVMVVGVCRALRQSWTMAGASVAVGWWLVFSGKPTAAAAAAVFTAVALAASRSLTLRLIATAAVSLTLVAALTLAGMRMPPGTFVAFLAGGLDQEQLLDSHSDLLELLGFAPNPAIGLVTFGVPMLVAGVVATEISLRTQGRGRLAAALGLVIVVAAAVTAALVPSVTARGFGLQLLPAVLVVALFGGWLQVRGWWVARQGGAGTVAPRRRHVAVLAVLLALLPYTGAVGTNSPFSEAMSHYATLWLLATVVGVRALASSSGRRDAAERLTVVAQTVALVVTGAVVAAAVMDGGPNSLLGSGEQVALRRGSLHFPPAEADLARRLNALSAAGGLTDQTPVVDLTGISPGYAFQLGGVPIGREFYMGVFPGAPEAAAYALSRSTCQQRSRAWLLWAPDNRWDVSSKVYLDGRRIPDDYDQLMTFSPVQGPAAWRDLQIEVLRPKASPGGKGCSS